MHMSLQCNSHKWTTKMNAMNTSCKLSQIDYFCIWQFVVLYPSCRFLRQNADHLPRCHLYTHTPDHILCWRTDTDRHMEIQMRLIPSSQLLLNAWKVIRHCLKIIRDNGQDRPSSFEPTWFCCCC